MPMPWSTCAAPEPVSDPRVEEGAGVEDVGVLGIEADVIELMTDEAMEDSVPVADDDAVDSVDDIFQDGWNIQENVCKEGSGGRPLVVWSQVGRRLGPRWANDTYGAPVVKSDEQRKTAN